MKIKCDFSATTTKQYSTCCLRSANDGGFCLENTGTTPSTTQATFVLTNDNFTTWAATPQALTTNHSDWEADATTANIEGF